MKTMGEKINEADKELMLEKYLASLVMKCLKEKSWQKRLKMVKKAAKEL